MYAHAATILLAAFLLFLAQPLLGRYILPRYGGAPGVWTVALLFFQAALLAGYTYAHVLTKLARPRMQGVVHGLLVLGGLAFLPIIPPASVPGDAPTLEILWLLLATIGLPFVLLASTSPLLQAWLGDASRTPRVYRLYALSNVGSLVALLAYPFALEPWIGRSAQAWGWSGGYALFALATLSVVVRRVWQPAKAVDAPPPGEAPGVATRVLWVGLAACGVWMLMAVTNRMTLNIAPTPFLWVLPLGLYLLSFAVGFSGRRWYSRRLMLPSAVGSVALFSIAASGSVDIAAVPRVLMFAAALLTICLVLHAELYRIRPDTTRLTGFYLSVAGGGALGGLIVGVVAPRVFPMYWEYEIGQVLSVMAVLGALAIDPSSRPRRFVWAGIAILMLLWIDVYATSMRAELRLTRESRRSFFGVTRVTEDDGVRTLVHGTTNHGTQFLDERANQPTTYFGASSGVGRVLNRAGKPRRIGIIGLGVGTMGVYGRERDVYRFYELDPGVVQLARGHFTYLEASHAQIEIVIGDGRLALQSEDPLRLDVLILDAFSSGAVPIHLLTLEAFDIYKRHLTPGAIIAVNITNHNLDLRSVVGGAARENGWQWTEVNDNGDPADGTLHSRWVLLARNLRAHGFTPDATEYALPPWTDDFSNLFRVLK